VKSIKKSFQFGAHQVTLETGEIARQADGACLVTVDDTVVLVTCVGRADVKPGRTSSRSPSTTRRRPTPRAASRVASSSARAALPRRKSSPAA